MKVYKTIGVMSGTSMDGVDIAYCLFIEEENQWQFTIESAETIAYSDYWKNKLSTIEKAGSLDIARLHVEYGHYIGKIVSEFINKHQISPDLIGSHGHTIFHQPENGFTLQIGDGAAIASHLNCPVINDFRSLDVALGGQGAPLVPIGDQLLFSQYDYCLNLGGFANVSFNESDKRLAYDICPVNIALNYLANQSGKEYDNNGEVARSGSVDQSLLKKLNGIAYYSRSYPKSLGKEWLIKEFLPIVDGSNLQLKDIMRTVSEHISVKVSESISRKDSNVLITGGGAYNTFLIDLIKSRTDNKITIPEKKIVEYKEAMIFAFLGLLRAEGKINTLSSVTGAKRDSIGGCLYN
jgi:anhydro-N-acetylmuramic acid kinase